MSGNNNDIHAYAAKVGVDRDTATTHLLLFEIFRATDLGDDKQREGFETLRNLVDPHRLAAAVRDLAKQLAEPGPKGTGSLAHSAADEQGYSWSPAEEVPWSRVMAALPDEATTLQTLLAKGGLSLDEFCRWRDGDCELYDEDDGDLPDDQDPPIEEMLEIAWDHLAHRFEGATGMRLYTFCRHHGESGDPETGFEIVGGWERSPTGKRFFGLGS